SSGADVAAALAGATREALRRLAAVWGEEIVAHAPEPAPLPSFHRAYHSFPPNQGLIHRWLDGRRPSHPALQRPAFDGEATPFVDLTPQHLIGSLAVAKASSPRARILRYGLPQKCGAFPHPID